MTPDPNLGPDEIDASPTKQLFISMLTRDVSLIEAIGDLVDNSVDGAHRFDPTSLEGRWVRIEIASGKFLIFDNCGGMPLKTAKKYAFKFGRDDTFPPANDHDLGRFGVGMKRTIFKLGRRFEVKSTHSDQPFMVAEDIDNWLKDPRWVFQYSELHDPTPLHAEEAGTYVGVFRLNPGVSDAFKRPGFAKELRDSLAKSHRESIDKGLRILVNGSQVKKTVLNLATSPDLIPINYSDTLQSEYGPVKIRIMAGISPHEKSGEPGWYVYCNDREVIHADRTLLTGWGDEEGKRVPIYHPQFSRFRGAVYFESSEPMALPWNTSKTDLDTDSPVFRSARVKMLSAMREVIDFINEVKREPKGGVLHQTVDKAKATALHKLEESNSFVKPNREQTADKNTQISYKRSKDLVQAVKDHLGASSNAEVGEMTFDAYVDAEGIE